MTGANCEISWATAADDPGPLAAFFAAEVDSAYVSHGDILCGRAQRPGEWDPDLEGIVREEVSTALAGVGTRRVLVARDGIGTVGLCIVDRPSAGRVWVVEDVVVARRARSHGIGAAMVERVAEVLTAEGAEALVLESSHGNERAHVFFRRQGFSPISVSMIREL